MGSIVIILVAPSHEFCQNKGSEMIVYVPVWTPSYLSHKGDTFTSINMQK